MLFQAETGMKMKDQQPLVLMKYFLPKGSLYVSSLF
jgi:hypothetical protein